MKYLKTVSSSKKRSNYQILRERRAFDAGIYFNPLVCHSMTIQPLRYRRNNGCEPQFDGLKVNQT